MISPEDWPKIISILCLSTMPFITNLEGDFVFDDSEAIVKNIDVTSDSWLDPFYHDFWGTNITSNLSHKSYRPFTVLSFRLNYLLNFRELSPTQFKILNMIFHSSCSILVWYTYERIIRRVKFKQTTVYSTDIAYSAAVVFCSHPVHVEAISGIVGRADILAGLTFFLSFLCYDEAMNYVGMKYINLIGVVALAGCSMLFKENGVTVLGFCLLYELIVKLKIKTKKSQESPELSNTTYHLCRNSVSRIICIVAAAIVLLYSRWTVMGGTKPVFKPTDNPAAFSDDTFVKVATYSYIYFLNILLLIWPQWLCYDWSMGCVPLIKNIQDYRIILSASVYVLGIMFVIGIFVVNTRKSTKRMLAIATCLIIVPFLPAANILYPVGFVIAERILYISSAGYCLLLGIGLNKVIQIEKTRWVALLSFWLVMTSCAGRSYKRSKDWQNEYQLFISGLSICPLNAKIHYNVAKVADAKNKTDWALSEYKEAIRLYPGYYQALNNLANLLKNQKKFDEAEYYLKKSLSYKEDFPAAWMNLGIIYAHTGRFETAHTAYNNALSYRSNYPDCHYNIGNLYLQMNKTEAALKHWYHAIQLKRGHVSAWTNIIALLDETGQKKKALQIIPKALKEVPESASLQFVVANIYGKMNMYDLAETHFLKAISLFGKRVQALHFSNLGVLYHRWKKYDLAEEMYKKALTIDPNSNHTAKNLLNLQKIRKKHGT